MLSINNSTPVLVFSPLKKLVGCFRSVSATAKVFNVTSTCILFACTGKSVSACGYYFRYYAPEIWPNVTDKLTLEQYDRLQGVERVYNTTGEMAQTTKQAERKAERARQRAQQSAAKLYLKELRAKRPNVHENIQRLVDEIADIQNKKAVSAESEELEAYRSNNVK